VIRIAAVGDIHLGESSRGTFRPAFEELPERADVLLLAGDLTRHGTSAEAKVLADEVADLGVPVVAVLGNHDWHSDAADEVTRRLNDVDVQVLEGTGTVLRIGGCRLGIAGTKGFCCGFPGRQASEFGEPEMRAFVRHARDLADGFGSALRALDCDVRVGLTHYSPVRDTLAGEPPEIHAFLGDYHLAEALDAAHADLAVHGHAHAGSPRGVTAGGVRVRNVAHPVIQCAYVVFELPNP
jgi:Icc-related predicted phosphoesterase